MTRTHLRQTALGIATAVLLSACATQAPMQPGQPLPPGQTAPEIPQVTPEMAAAAETLTRMASLQDRLYKVAAPLLIDNAELCTRHARNLLGFTAKNRYTYPGSYNDAAHAVLGMGERLQVTNVLAGSGAAKAGLRNGDELVAAGGKPLPTGPNALSQAGAVFGPIVAKQASLPLTIERRGSQRDVTVPVTRACAFGIELGNADNVNAYADGQRVMVTRGMMGFVQNDDELAYVVAHTMAHNMLNHAASQRNAATIGSIIDNLTRIAPDTSMLIGSGGRWRARRRRSSIRRGRCCPWLCFVVGKGNDTKNAASLPDGGFVGCLQTAETNADAPGVRVRWEGLAAQGVSGLLADFLALTSATALSIAAMRCASAGWLAVWPFSTVAG